MGTMILMLSLLVIILLSLVFFFLSKSEKWDLFNSSSFECGFTSYFYSRFSFSIHYFLVGLIFLFLDLELCFIMPFFNETLSSLTLLSSMSLFILILLIGLMKEWQEGEIEWKF